MEFESSIDEEEVTDFDIVISEVCSVLDAEQVEQVGRVVENPLFRDNSDIEDEEETEENIVKASKARDIDDLKEFTYGKPLEIFCTSKDDSLSSEKSLKAVSSPRSLDIDCESRDDDLASEKSFIKSISNLREVDESSTDPFKDIPSTLPVLRSRSVSSCVDDTPNQGLCDEESQVIGGVQDTNNTGLDDQVGSLVWAKMKGYPPWPALVVPDPVSGMSKEKKKGGEYWHVLFLEYRNEVAWINQNQIEVFSSKGSGKVKKGNSKALVKAVELATNLSSMSCMDRITKFTEYQYLQDMDQRIPVEEKCPKLSMNPVVKLKRLKVSKEPVVMLERLKYTASNHDNDDLFGESDGEKLMEENYSDSNYDTDDLLGDSDELSGGSDNENVTDEKVFTNVKVPSTSSDQSDGSGWCEGMLVWARVQGYPFWPAVIVREQKSDEFSIPSKTGLVRIHVMFLAFHKQTALVGETSLVPFCSDDQFKDLLRSASKKSQKDFRPSKTLAPKFNLAVKTAMELLPRSLYNRLEYLYT